MNNPDRERFGQSPRRDKSDYNRNETGSFIPKKVPPSLKSAYIAKVTIDVQCQRYFQ